MQPELNFRRRPRHFAAKSKERRFRRHLSFQETPIRRHSPELLSYQRSSCGFLLLLAQHLRLHGMQLGPRKSDSWLDLECLHALARHAQDLP